MIDERYNQGGDIADYVIDVLKRTPMLAYESRQGLKTTEPTGAIFGPKAMLINQNAGSGGDAMPVAVPAAAKLGPLVVDADLGRAGRDRRGIRRCSMADR